MDSELGLENGASTREWGHSRRKEEQDPELRSLGGSPWGPGGLRVVEVPWGGLRAGSWLSGRGCPPLIQKPHGEQTHRHWQEPLGMLVAQRSWLLAQHIVDREGAMVSVPGNAQVEGQEGGPQ